MLGILSLNISFVLHVILYIPQVLHNRNAKHIQYLSVNMHLILFFSYFFDVFYGFGIRMPWQYLIVSIAGFSLLVVQYIQIINNFSKNNKRISAHIHLGVLAVCVFCIYYFLTYLHSTLPIKQILYSGYVSKALFIISTIPQLIKNWKVKTTDGVSVYFVLFSITIASLDTITAWSLDWQMQNKLTSPIMIFMFGAMLPFKKSKIYIQKLALQR